MKILTNLDLNRNEIQNARMQNLATAPSNPVAGQIYFNSADKTFYGWNGTSWKDLGQVLTGDSIITLLNASSLKIDDDNLSANANDAINKRHSHSNKTTLDAITAAYTTAEKTKLAGIEDGANKYIHPSSHPASMITGLATVATSGSYNDLSNKPTLGTAASKNTGTSVGQIPILGTGGKLDDLVIPKIAISETSVVNTQAAMLALTAEIGDVCVRTDLSKTFILKAEPASTLANWQELITPESPVQSVNGKVGVVVLTKADVGLGNVDNKSSATIRSEITETNVTTALGYTPIKDGGDTPEIKSGLESARPTASNSGIIYFATDTKKIWKDTGSWTQMGGQDVPIASRDVLGLIKVGANLSILSDGTLNANDNPSSFLIQQEVFTAQAGQTTFDLTKGTYKPGTNTIFWYMYGQKQPNDALIEVSPTRFQIAGGVPEDTDIIVEYIEVINTNPFPYHADKHLTGGVDPIPKATTTADGLMAKEDKTKLNGIENGANKYTHPSTHPASMITEDTSRRFVSDAEKTTWNSRTKKYAVNVGDGTATEYTITHNLGTKDLAIGLEEVATGEMVFTDIQKVDTNKVKLLFAQAPASNQYRLTVVG